MIIFIRIVLIYFIIGCLLGLGVNWIFNTVYADKAKWLNRRIKDDMLKSILLTIVFLWPACIAVSIYLLIKDKRKIDDKITDMILDNDFYEDES